MSELFKDQQSRVEIYEKVLLAAEATQVPKPTFSDYFVKTGVGSAVQSFPAGNIEYGCCSAIHGEESGVSVFRSQAGRASNDPLAIGFIDDEPGDVVTPAGPCGNCRDVTLEDFGSGFDFVSGSRHGGQALVVPMRHYLYDSYLPIELQGAQIGREDQFFARKQEEMFLTAKEAMRRGRTEGNDMYTAKVPRPRQYSVVVVTEKGAWYFGSHDVMCDYHPLYAGRDAIRQAWRVKDILMKYVLVVVDDCLEPPRVMYEDRQHLLEFNQYGELLTGQNRNLPVYLWSFKDNATRGIWRTSVKEWLPFPFAPRAFGQEFVEYLTGRLKQRMPEFEAKNA